MSHACNDSSASPRSLKTTQDGMSHSPHHMTLGANIQLLPGAMPPNDTTPMSHGQPPKDGAGDARRRCNRMFTKIFTRLLQNILITKFVLFYHVTDIFAY
jgi:hypothetical protein